MPLRGSVNCLNLFFIVLLSFLKHTQSIKPTPIGKQQEFHAVKKSVSEVNNLHSKFKRPDWATNILRQDEEEYLLDAGEELGFDLNDEERKKFKLWVDGVIPYYIDVVSYDDKVIRDRIRSFLYEVNAATKISFVELPSPPTDLDTRWVFFINRRGQLGCSDHSIQNLTIQGVQPVVLGYDCLATGNELAEAVLAIAGVPPQHNSPDRDLVVKVNYENIIPEKKYLFEKLKDNEWLFHDLKYDARSAGHFSFHKHSSNGRLTMEIVDPQYLSYSNTNEGSNKLSILDILKLRMLYNYSVRQKSSRGSGCDKLFQNNNNEAPSMGVLYKSRPKPNRYLGQPDDQTPEPDADQNDDGITGEEEIDGENENDDPDDGEDESKPKKDSEKSTKHIFRAQHKINSKVGPHQHKKIL
ncbi:hypothetical protein B5X24_HaOG208031 [Helicoverpa armigera]|nr:hypothetical protein B5X24_HaOG208031 [Helicoverpa armigera]